MTLVGISLAKKYYQLVNDRNFQKINFYLLTKIVFIIIQVISV